MGAENPCTLNLRTLISEIFEYARALHNQQRQLQKCNNTGSCGGT